jgi:hypothetical protein
MSNDRQNDGDRLLDDLSSLTVRDVDDLRRERIRLRARQVLQARSEAVKRSALVRRNVVFRYLEPALVSSFSLFVLAWAVERTLSILSP